jgi:cysteine desulfurase family protein (TIGR01976 family)
MSFPIEAVRARFPALHVTDAGCPRAYFDAPGGTQIVSDALAAMTEHLAGGTANAGGAFASSVATDAMSANAHRAAADLLNALPEEIAFGPNMTTLTLSVSRALARAWEPGDELVVTRLDHDANVAPWLAVAADRGMTVRWLDFDPDTGQLCLDQLPGLLSQRTRLVAVGGASNALGTVNDLQAIVATVRSASDALVFVDAVQLAPHLPIDVAAIGCDLLACSPYKFFGPHLGILWCRAKLAEATEAYKVRPASTRGAVRFETGTPSFEAQAGFTATVEYLAWLGQSVAPAAATRRDRIVAALEAATSYEMELGEHLLAGLARFSSVRMFGPPTMAGRVPTFAFRVEGHAPADVARHLAGRGIFAWSGHFYAVETVARLELAESGGLVRVGLCHYNTAGEVDRFLAAVGELTADR